MKRKQHNRKRVKIEARTKLKDKQGIMGCILGWIEARCCATDQELLFQTPALMKIEFYRQDEIRLKVQRIRTISVLLF